MQHRPLGTTGLEVSPIGVGCNRLTHPSRDRREVVATLEAALDQGINYFDTADYYGFGASERLLGEVLSGRRDQVVICSKAGKRHGPVERLRDRLRPYAQRLRKRSSSAREVITAVTKARPAQRFDEAYITQSVERCLQRLRTDYLDLFLFHNPQPETVGDGRLFELGTKLQARGLIRHYGVACGSELLEDPKSLERLLAAPGLAALQMRVNFSTAGTIGQVLPPAAGKGIPVIAFEPFEKGALLSHPHLDAALAGHPGYTAAQLALSFVLAQPAVSVVLVGMTRRAHLAENLAVLEAPPPELGALPEPMPSPAPDSGA